MRLFTDKEKQELPYFEIDGAFGGCQDWFTNLVMHFGGCAAATACDCCIYFAAYFGMEKLYPFPLHKLNKKDYCDFSQIMKPYIRPRIQGVRRTEWFVREFTHYIEDVNAVYKTAYQLEMSSFSGERDWREAAVFIKEQVDAKMPIPYLMLQHRAEKQYKDFIWHWFMLVGYEDRADGFYIKAATYGEVYWFLLEDLWNTGNEEKGGMVKFTIS